MSRVYVECKDDRRAQGTLVIGEKYEYLGSRMAKSKDGVTRKEVRIVNATGSAKWYDAARFDTTVVDGSGTVVSSLSAISSAPVEKTEEVKKERVSMTKPTTTKKMTLSGFLQSQDVSDDLIRGLIEFRKEHHVDDDVKSRVILRPSALYVGGEAWSLAISGILEGRDLLLVGEKATGKNVLADNLGFAFGRPMWDISMHVNIDSSSLIGADTFKGGEVTFRPGSVHNVAQYGGFGVLDEINMAKNEAVAVLHAMLDDRGVIDVPGYERIHRHTCSRFIATMNHGYVGTRELNEALVSRFIVIHVEHLSNRDLIKLLNSKYDGLTENVAYFAKLFNDLQAKAKSGEISTRSVDLRGIIDSLGLIDRGITPLTAVTACVVNKSFDVYERTKVMDVVKTLIPDTWTRKEVFKTAGASEELTVDFSSAK